MCVPSNDMLSVNVGSSVLIFIISVQPVRIIDLVKPVTCVWVCVHACVCVGCVCVLAVCVFWQCVTVCVCWHVCVLAWTCVHAFVWHSLWWCWCMHASWAGYNCIVVCVQVNVPLMCTTVLSVDWVRGWMSIVYSYVKIWDFALAVQMVFISFCWYLKWFKNSLVLLD